MNFEFPADDGPLDPSWTAPLAAVFDHLAPDDDDLLHHFDPREFMIMARLVRPPRPTILIYKHPLTRSSLHLDADGQAYRYLEPKTMSGRPGRHVRQPLDEAIRALGLEQLPWMKPGLEHEQHGLTYERWRLLPAARRLARSGRAPSVGPHLDDRSDWPDWSDATDDLTDPNRVVAPALSRGGARRGHLYVVRS